MSTDFWAAITAQLEELKTAATADDVVRILAHSRNPYGAGHSSSGDGFFAGSGGDGTVCEALIEAGWRVTWSQASYYYTVTAPDGSMITYIEGDIYRGPRGGAR